MPRQAPRRAPQHQLRGAPAGVPGLVARAGRGIGSRLLERCILRAGWKPGRRRQEGSRPLRRGWKPTAERDRVRKPSCFSGTSRVDTDSAVLSLVSILGLLSNLIYKPQGFRERGASSLFKSKGKPIFSRKPGCYELGPRDLRTAIGRWKMLSAQTSQSLPERCYCSFSLP